MKKLMLLAVSVLSVFFSRWTEAGSAFPTKISTKGYTFGGSWDVVREMVIDNEGNMFVCGYKGTPLNPSSLDGNSSAVTRINKDGNQIWVYVDSVKATLSEENQIVVINDKVFVGVEGLRNQVSKIVCLDKTSGRKIGSKSIYGYMPYLATYGDTLVCVTYKDVASLIHTDSARTDTTFVNVMVVQFLNKDDMSLQKEFQLDFFLQSKIRMKISKDFLYITGDDYISVWPWYQESSAKIPLQETSVTVSPVWVKKSLNMNMSDIAVDSTGNVFIAGSRLVWHKSETSDVLIYHWLFKLDENGNQLKETMWLSRDRDDLNQENWTTSIVVLPNGDVVTLGSFQTGNVHEYGWKWNCMRLSSNDLDSLWESRWDYYHPWDDPFLSKPTVRPGGVDIDPDMNLIVFGTSWNNDTRGIPPNVWYIEKYSVQGVLGVKIPNSEIPEKFELFQNYPNPFNPSTTIRFALPHTEYVTLKVYDILGREVSTLINEKMSAGSHEISFDGSKLSSGVYIYRLQTGVNVETKKMSLVK